MKNKKLILILLFWTIILIVPNLVWAKSLNVFPNAISIEYEIGDSQPPDRSITFNNTDNTSFSIALTKNGSGTSYYNISATTLGFSGNESKAVSLDFGIPQDVTSNIYSSKIWYGDGDEYIPIFITVTAKAATSTGCKILMPSELFSRSIKKGIPPFTQDFLLRISNKCINGLTIIDIRESGQVTDTEQGRQPIRLTGSIPKGDYEKGQTTTMSVEFDVSELSFGDYRASVVITSTEGEEQITQKMDFRIFVVGTASAVTNETFSTLPTCNPSTTDLQIGKTYSIICNNVVDTNIKLHIDDDSLEYVKGLSSEYPSNQIIWRFTPIKLGNTELIFYLTDDKGLPIGDRQEVDIRISQTPSGELGTRLKFDFFPKTLDIDNLKVGDSFSVLIKAVNPDYENDTGTIIEDVVLYKDGKQTDDRTFTVAGGETFTLSASAVGFRSINKDIVVPQQIVSVTYVPYDVEVGRNVTFTTTPDDAKLLINGLEIPKVYSFGNTGTFTLTATREGYQEGFFSIAVSEPLRFLSEIPEKIRIGGEVMIELNKPVKWYVSVQEDNETEELLFAEGDNNFIQFIPDRKGIYEIYVRDSLVEMYDLTGISLYSIVIIIVGIAGFGTLLYFANKYEWFKLRGRGIKKSEKIKRSPFELDIKSGEAFE